MRVLFLTPQLPFPATQGAAIRNSQLIAGLAARHAVTLLTFAPPGEAAGVWRGAAIAARRGGMPPLAALILVPLPQRTLRDRLHTLLRTPLPDMARRLAAPAMAVALARVMAEEPPDWTIVEGIEMAPYRHQIRSRWLFDDHNAEYLLQGRAALRDMSQLYRPRAAVGAAYSAVQWLRLRRYERTVCRASDAVTVVSPADRAALLRLDPTLDVTVVPNGVDLAAWSPPAIAPDPPAAALAAAGPLLVFDGSMDFRPNVDAVRWFCGGCWPAIRAAHPTAGFAIVGRNPTPAVQALAALPGVRVTGAVADTRPWVAAATVYVVPMRVGGGVRLKLLQALALGRPVVSTPLGAEGIALTADRDLLLAATAPAFRAAVLVLLADPARRATLGHAARHAVAPYAWDRIVPLLEAVVSRQSSVVSRQSAVGGRRLPVASWRSAVGGRRSPVASWRSAVGGRRSPVGGQRSPVGGRRSVVDDQGVGIAAATSTIQNSELRTPNSELPQSAIRNPQSAIERVSLILTVRNEAASIGALLDSLRRQTRAPDEVVIVDGGSTDGTQAQIRAAAAGAPWPVRLIEQPGANISQGRNRAIAAAAGPLIAATDAGVRLPPGWLAALVAPFAAPAGATVDVASGFFTPDPQTVFERAMGATVLPAVSDIRPATFLPSSRSVAFRKAAWAAVGGYPAWLDYSEDLVFDLALRAQGCRFVFVPAAVVLFRPRGNLAAFYRQYYRYARGDGKADLWRKRHAVRYATYVLGPGLALAARKQPWLGVILVGAAAAYCATPYRRLLPWLTLLPPLARLQALAWVPIIRLVGDGAKMVGYPVGVVWRLRRRRFAHALHRRLARRA